MPLLLGAHTIDNGGIDMAALRAGNAGMSALQIFTAIPKYYGDKQSIRPERVERFKAALDEGRNRSRSTWSCTRRTCSTRRPTTRRSGCARAMGSRRSSSARPRSVSAQLCFHPGAATGGDRASAAKRVAKAITHALQTVKGNTRVLIENTAGAGLTMGRTPEEIGMMLEDVPASLRERTGFGLDTCHLYAAGHDITRLARGVHEDPR